VIEAESVPEFMGEDADQFCLVFVLIDIDAFAVLVADKFSFLEFRAIGSADRVIGAYILIDALAESIELANCGVKLVDHSV